jgi:hypothetical protein
MDSRSSLSAEDQAALFLGTQIHRACSLEAQLAEVVAQRDELLKKVHYYENLKGQDEQPEAAPVDGAAEAS